MRAEKERHLHLVAGIAEGVEVDSSLVRLPDGALVFPAIKGGSLTPLQNAESITGILVRHAAKLGFPGMRFHDLRASQGTALLDRGVEVRRVAERLAHDPALLLRVTPSALRNPTRPDIIGTMTKTLL